MSTLTALSTATALSLLPEWELAMTAENKSPLTIKGYAGAVRQHLTWSTAHGLASFELGTLNRWVADALAAGRSRATARTRQLAVRRFAAWLLATGRVGDDPFGGVKTPKAEPPLMHPLTDDELRALLRTCDVADDARPDLLLQHRRDEAIIRLMLETAIRTGEVVAWRSETSTPTPAWSPSGAARAAEAESSPSGRSRTARCGPTCISAPRTPWRQRPNSGSAPAAARWATKGSETPCAVAPSAPASRASTLTHRLRHTAGAPLARQRRIRSRADGHRRLVPHRHAGALHPRPCPRARRRGSLAPQPRSPMSMSARDREQIANCNCSACGTLAA